MQNISTVSGNSDQVFTTARFFGITIVAAVMMASAASAWNTLSSSDSRDELRLGLPFIASTGFRGQRRIRRCPRCDRRTPRCRQRFRVEALSGAFTCSVIARSLFCAARAAARYLLMIPSSCCGIWRWRSAGRLEICTIGQSSVNTSKEARRRMLRAPSPATPSSQGRRPPSHRLWLSGDPSGSRSYFMRQIRAIGEQLHLRF